VQNDLKRVVAYSTCSQLGYMVFACGLSNYSVGIFHLTNHAFSKHYFLKCWFSDTRGKWRAGYEKNGGLKPLVPFTYSMMVIGSLALMGFLLTGFYSKDLILEVAYGKYTSIGYFSYCLGTMGVFYSFLFSIALLNFYVETIRLSSSYLFCLWLRH
jgi:NADH-ubiquinone oxidoreductase chain 5